MFTTTYHSKPIDGSFLESDNLEELARNTNFIRRKRANFSAHGFVLSLLKSVITSKTSLSEASYFLESVSQAKYSKQAFQQRMNARAEGFMESLIGYALANKFNFKQELSQLGFNHVYVQDASTTRVHHSHSDTYTATGSYRQVSGGFKTDLCVDLASGKIAYLSAHSSKTNDKIAGKRLVPELQENDLLMRDLGYYSVDGFKNIEAQRAYWLSKIPTNAGAIEVVTNNSLDEILLTTKSDKIDINVELAKGFPARLVAVRATPQQAKQKRLKASTAAKKQNKQPKANADLRHGWHIVVTNIKRERLNVEKLMHLYRVRWQIETIFRAWKRSSDLAESFRLRKNTYHLKCLAMTALLWLILTVQFSFSQTLSNTKKEVSIELASSWLSIQLLSERDFSILVNPTRAKSSIFMDSRKRTTLIKSLEKCLN